MSYYYSPQIIVICSAGVSPSLDYRARMTKRVESSEEEELYLFFAPESIYFRCLLCLCLARPPARPPAFFLLNLL
jgi:hypothetical protein